ncbi:MAG: hypothetical protein HYY04_06340 [Chloroflexi bacterium]|nr:hypothetical protein [Chloroflexota bacterium]
MSRTMTPLPVREAGPTRTACSHLGLENDPFAHHDEPSSEHRCYLWMQRDRIDLAHQRAFCLSGASARCPWLTISTPEVPETPWQRLTSWFADALAELDGPRTGRLYLVVRTIVALVVEVITAIARQVAPIAQQALARLRATDVRRALTPGPSLAGRGASVEKVDVPPATESRQVHAREGEPMAADGPTTLTPALSQRDRESTVQRAAPARRAARADGTPDFATVLDNGIAAVRAGDKRQARALLKEATRLNPGSKDAWLWRAAVAARPTERKRYLEEVHRLDPDSGRVAALLDEQDETVARGAGTRNSGARTPVATPPASAATWECADCLKLNAATASTCARCGRPSPALEQQLVANEEFLLLDGLQAFRRGDEEAAHRCFAVAAEAAPDNELAWYWRAKTADSTAEVVACLERLVERHPENDKARLDLEWARSRLAREQEAVRPVTTPAPDSPATPGPLAWLRPALFDLTGLLAFCLGLFWLSFEVVRSAALPGIETLARTGILPKITPPTWTVTLDSTFLNDANLGLLVPSLLGLLAVKVAWSLAEHGTRHRAEVFSLALLSALGAVLMVTNGPGIILGLALTAGTLAGGLLAGEQAPMKGG